MLRNGKEGRKNLSSRRKMDKKIFQPEKYGMVICPRCSGKGHIQNHKRLFCPICGGFGFVRKETEKGANTSTNSD
jgi:DnaJ-class molecular chaperone